MGRPPLSPHHWIVLEGGCWEWQRALTRGGYGSATLASGECRRAHRWVYESRIGPIPDGLQLDHLCRNKRCVNPDHLEPVTHAENQRRAAATRTNCKHGHEFTIENTYLNGGGRHCRTCMAAKSAALWERRRPLGARRRSKRSDAGVNRGPR